jgi:hypothetical protein
MISIASPTSVSIYWSVIKFAILNSSEELSKLDDKQLNTLLGRIMAQQAQVWLSIEEDQLIGVVITYITIDPLTDVRRLLIYSLYSFQTTTKAMWEDGFDKLTRFAKTSNCQYIDAFTNNPAIERLTKDFFTVKYIALTKEV